ncbi:MAG: hypothetical protein J1F07_04210 [Muribaculaceae bacterium]|nr:hypothetical protein [Muribaculaceae bacterium]
MKKSLLLFAAASLALGAYAADEPTYNFFNPKDCDADGWLWLDSQAKLDKYVGKGKKIQLVAAQYEVEDPEFPGEYTYPQCEVSPDFKGYNQLGEEGGEGSVTGGIMLPAASYDPEEDWWATDGGGILVAMPDCAVFEVYVSQKYPDVKFEIYAAKEETDDYTQCDYVWDDDPDIWTGEGGPVITDYAGPYLNIQDLKYDLNMGEGEPDYLTIYGAKGEPRTAYIANYTNSEDPEQNTCLQYIHGIRVLTYTNTVPADDVPATPEGEEGAVKAISSLNADAPMYDVFGRKVSKDFRGIYIQNGKKYVNF